jgi:hypothetical protein
MRSVSEPRDRDPYVTTGLVCARLYERKSHEEIAEELGFDSVEELRAKLQDWNLPPWLVGAEGNSVTNKPREKNTPRARSLGPAQELPPASSATELFRERLEALLKDVELLEHMDEKLHGKYFARENVGVTSVWTSRERSPKEVWEALCERYGYDPEDKDLKGLLDTNVPIKSPGGVAKWPSEVLTTLMGVYALADGRMDLLVDALHPNPSSVTAETWKEIRQCVDGARPDDKKDGLKFLARHLATWVRGGEVGPGKPAERSEMYHGAARAVGRYRKQGLTDQEIADKLSHPLVGYTKEDGTSYTAKDIAELGALGLN